VWLLEPDAVRIARPVLRGLGGSNAPRLPDHSGIGFLTPASVHYGQATTILNQRNRVLRAAYSAHPERFVSGPPTAPEPPPAVWINPPKEVSIDTNAQ